MFLLTIICRYTNVAITLNSLVTFLAVIALNYCFYFKLLEKLKTEEIIKVALAESLKEFYLSIILMAEPHHILLLPYQK